MLAARAKEAAELGGDAIMDDNENDDNVDKAEEERRKKEILEEIRKEEELEEDGIDIVEEVRRMSLSPKGEMKREKAKQLSEAKPKANRGEAEVAGEGEIEIEETPPVVVDSDSD